MAGYRKCWYIYPSMLQHRQHASALLSMLYTGLRTGSFFVPLKKEKMKSYHDYQQCIEACLRCAALCQHCATSCTREKEMQMMADCIRLDMECAALCYAAAQLMSMGSDSSRDLCRICAEVCRRCAAECSRHNNEHCRECAEACTTCAELCSNM